MAIFYIILIIAGYLLGSIMFCKTIPLKFCKVDVCKHSSDHNPGSHSVFECCGVKMGLFCLSLDILKGFVPVFLAVLFLNVRHFLFPFVMAAPVLGHALGMFNHFQGGKCIATSFGVTLGILPKTIIPFVALALFFIIFWTVFKLKSKNARSILVFSLFALASVLLIFKGEYAIYAGCLAIAAIAIFKHARCMHQVIIEEREGSQCETK